MSIDKHGRVVRLTGNLELDSATAGGGCRGRVYRQPVQQIVHKRTSTTRQPPAGCSGSSGAEERCRRQQNPTKATLSQRRLVTRSVTERPSACTAPLEFNREKQQVHQVRLLMSSPGAHQA